MIKQFSRCFFVYIESRANHVISPGMKEVDNLRKYYKLYILPAIIVIIAGFFSGFSGQSYSQIAENLLRERTDLLQNAYYGGISMDQAEKNLGQIETYPLLSEDVGYLRDMGATDLDRVKSMEFIEITQESKLFPYVSLTVTIRWHMNGAGEDYISTNEYFVILKSINNGYVLTEFNPKQD